MKDITSNREKNRGWLKRLFPVVGLLLLTGLSCRLPFLEGETAVGGTARIDEGIAATLTAQPRDEMGGQPTETSQPPTMTDTPTSVPDTRTPTLTPTMTNTPTPQSASVSVTGNTYCRFGPGDVYDALGILNTDQESEIIAKNSTGTFWYIVNPDDPNSKCWIWGNYATPQGPTDQLPVYTPPPTPTPSAKIAASYNYVCGSWAFDFEVKNTGGVPLESYSITLKDTVSGNSETTQVNQWPGACTGGGPEVLDPGQTGRAYAQFKKNNPLAHKIQATLKACERDNMGGVCTTTSFTFEESK